MQVVDSWKWAPVIVTLVPPVRGPSFGESEAIVGRGTDVNDSPVVAVPGLCSESSVAPKTGRFDGVRHKTWLPLIQVASDEG